MTHNDRVLALLSDGRPHSHHELYGLHVIAHSRVSDLRKRGHVIESWREGSDYLYQLTSGTEPGGQSPPQGRPWVAPQSAGEAEYPLSPSSPSVPEQLALVAA